MSALLWVWRRLHRVPILDRIWYVAYLLRECRQVRGCWLPDMVIAADYVKDVQDALRGAKLKMRRRQ